MHTLQINRQINPVFPTTIDLFACPQKILNASDLLFWVKMISFKRWLSSEIITMYLLKNEPQILQSVISLGIANHSQSPPDYT